MTWYVQIEHYKNSRADCSNEELSSLIWQFRTEKEAAAFLKKAARLPYHAVSLAKWSDDDD